MPVSGLPDAVEVLLTSLIEKSMLTSWKVVGERRHTVVVLRFEADDSHPDSTAVPSRVHWRKKTPSQLRRDQGRVAMHSSRNGEKSLLSRHSPVKSVERDVDVNSSLNARCVLMRSAPDPRVAREPRITAAESLDLDPVITHPNDRLSTATFISARSACVALGEETLDSFDVLPEGDKSPTDDVNDKCASITSRVTCNQNKHGDSVSAESATSLLTCDRGDGCGDDGIDAEVSGGTFEEEKKEAYGESIVDKLMLKFAKELRDREQKSDEAASSNGCTFSPAPPGTSATACIASCEVPPDPTCASSKENRGDKSRASVHAYSSKKCSSRNVKETSRRDNEREPLSSPRQRWTRRKSPKR